MLDDNLIKSIQATGEILDLDEAVIEKDYYVTQVIHTLSVEELHFIYHGSPYLFNVPKPMPSSRGTDGIIVWEGEAVFATYDRRIALHYTANKVEGYMTGVSLLDEIEPNYPMRLFLFGGKNISDALDTLYGNGNSVDSVGYLYVMDGSHFRWEEGLGIMERIAKPKPNETDFFIRCDQVNRRKEIDELISQERIISVWSPL